MNRFFHLNAKQLDHLIICWQKRKKKCIYEKSQRKMPNCFQKLSLVKKKFLLFNIKLSLSKIPTKSRIHVFETYLKNSNNYLLTNQSLKLQYTFQQNQKRVKHILYINSNHYQIHDRHLEPT